MYAGDPLARPILGKEETVESFTREGILGYMHRRYTPDNIVISCAGNFEREKLMDELNKRFGRISPSHDGSTRVSGAVAAVYFFVYGLTVGIGSSDGSKLKILALAPVIWCIFKLLYRFKRTISFVNVSDLLLELFEIVFMMLFFLALAQTVAKIDAPAVFWKLYAYGIPAAMFALICFLPRFIVMITGNSELLNAHHGVSYSDFGVALYIVYNLLTRAKAQTAETEK